ncbi:prolyl endopeptidase-like [Takifugu rubripes]|uniref:Prolyl endopeptidase n=1 Tax=Takifugu rubripes TaxID=31033 RepID=A0A3B5KLE3_TAKRU|nr:prolyl endopeptidase-like [Takifugu rubripes]
MVFRPCFLPKFSRFRASLRLILSADHKRNSWVYIQRYRASDSHSSVDSFTNNLEKYRDLAKYFSRRLKASYKRFSNIPDFSVICGHDHVYFIESDGIYRMDRRQSDMMPEQVLNLGHVSQLNNGLDIDKEKKIHQWTVQRIRLSPKEKHLAATVKSDYREELRCVIVKLGKANSSALEDPNIILSLDKVFSFEWATDDVLFYTTLEALRCSRVFRLSLTSAETEITSVHEETRPEVFVEVALSRDQRMLSINCTSRTTSEVLLVNLTTSPFEPFLVQPRQLDLLYHVEHWRGRLIILASTGPGQEYQVVQAPLSKPSMDSWIPLFTPEPGTIIKDMDIVGNHCVLVAKTPADEFILTVFPLASPKEVHTVQLPSWACSIKPKRPDMAQQEHVFEFLISSPVHSPVSCCLYPEVGLLATDTEGELSPESQDNIITTRLEARSKDGTSVPITLFHTLPVGDLREVPLLVHVYGAYGQDLNMEFRPEMRLLLEQGWTLAYCHIRGGGERGLSWQRQAQVEGKKKGLDDLRECLRHLFSIGISSPSLTALMAFSAGAVPVAALCNTHPHMMRAVTLQAPFLDVLGIMTDPSLPLTLEDREEWGDPVGNPQHKLSISSYCPLYNITPQPYPSILLTAYRDDSRIPLAGVLRYSQTLKSAINAYSTTKSKSEHEPASSVVLNIQCGANHLGPEDFQMMLEEEALKLAFLYTELRLDPPQPPRRRKR